jgi:hypothetical protein
LFGQSALRRELVSGCQAAFGDQGKDAVAYALGEAVWTSQGLGEGGGWSGHRVTMSPCLLGVKPPYYLIQNLDRSTLSVTGTLQWSKGVGLTISEPKTARSRRQLQLASAAVEGLRQHRARQAAEILASEGWDQTTDLVFPNHVGRPMQASNLLRRSFFPLLAAADLPHIRFHDLRHTAATLLLSRGVHPKIASEMLGHSTVAFTLDVYSHVTETLQREVARTMDSVLGEAL